MNDWPRGRLTKLELVQAALTRLDCGVFAYQAIPYAVIGCYPDHDEEAGFSLEVCLN